MSINPSRVHAILGKDWTFESTLGNGVAVVSGPQGRAVLKLWQDGGRSAQRMRAELQARDRIRASGSDVLAHGVHSTGSWVLRRFVEGVTLEEFLEREGRASVRATAQIGLALAHELRELHAAGMIQRDLKPDNVILRDGVPARAQLLDFDVSGTLDHEDFSRTAPLQLSGTPAYMSPEQVEGRPQGPAADIFGLGLLMLQMSTGQRAWAPEGASGVEVLTNIVRRDVATDTAPEPLRALVRKMTRRDPELRCSLDDVLRELAPLAEGQPPRSPAITQGAPMMAQLSRPPAPMSAGPAFGSPAPQRPPMPGAGAVEPATSYAPRPAVPIAVPSPASETPPARRAAGWPVVVVGIACVGAVVALAMLNLTFGFAVGPLPSAVHAARGVLVVLAPLSPVVGLVAYHAWLRRRIPTSLEDDLATLGGRPRSKKKLTESVAIELEAVVAGLRGLERARGLAILVLWEEYRKSDDDATRAALLRQFLESLGELSVLVAPWYVRHEKAITVAGLVITALGGCVSIWHTIAYPNA